MAYYRPPSPTRKILIPGRASTGNFDEYPDAAEYYSRSPRDHEYASPRSSTGVIPISTERYVLPASHSGSAAARTEAYSGRPRRSTLTDHRYKPVITQGGRPSSPISSSRHEREAYMKPASSRRREIVYPIDPRSSKYLEDDFDSRYHSDSERPRERERGPYRSRAPVSRPSREVDDSSYSYTDAAGMYAETEPRWRRRRDSYDRGSRPSSVVDPYGPPSRAATRELGPPPTSRGLDKLNDALSRNLSLRDPGASREPRSHSKDRAGTYDSYLSGHDPYVSRRPGPEDQYSTRPHSSRPTGGAYDDYHLQRGEDQRESRHHERGFRDEHVENRGFGIVGDRPKRDSSDEGSGPRLRPVSAIQYGNNDLNIPDTHRSAGSKEEQRALAERHERALVPRSPVKHEHGRDEYERRGEREYDRDVPRERERPRDYDYHRERDYERSRDYERDHHERRSSEYDDHDRHRATTTAAAAATAYAAASAAGAERHDRDRGRGERERERERPHARDVDRERERRREDSEEERHRRPSHRDTADREDRHEPEYTDRDRPDRRREEPAALDPDEEYRRRIAQQQQELARQEARPRDDPAGSKEFERDRERRHQDSQDSQATALSQSQPNTIFDNTAPLVSEPRELGPSTGALITRDEAERDKRVSIVEPPSKRESPPPPIKGILRKPTEKFPEHPNSIREGVAPLKDLTKKGVPPNARWTKVDRRLVNPAALEAAGERFEERLDCVIVLRVLTKEEIQKFADKTAEIRASRDERDDKDRKRRSRREGDDRDKRREYDSDEEEDRERRRRKEKERDEEEDRERRRRKEKERDRDRDKDRDREREKDRDREREREKDRDRERESGRERDRERERDRHGD